MSGAGLVLMEWGPTRTSPNPFRARVVNVYTPPAWRRQGFARALTRHVLQYAQQQGLLQLSLRASAMPDTLSSDLGFRTASHEMLLDLPALRSGGASSRGSDR